MQKKAKKYVFECTFGGLRNNERGRVSLNFELQRDRILRQTELDTDDTERSHFSRSSIFRLVQRVEEMISVLWGLIHFAGSETR